MHVRRGADAQVCWFVTTVIKAIVPLGLFGSLRNRAVVLRGANIAT